MAQICQWLLEKLACPLSKAPVIQVGDWIYSTDPATRLRYPVRDGIANMLIEESEMVTHAEFEQVMARRTVAEEPWKPQANRQRELVTARPYTA